MSISRESLNFHHLPSPILKCIAESLVTRKDPLTPEDNTVSTLNNLSQTCRLLNDEVTPELWRTVHLLTPELPQMWLQEHFRIDILRYKTLNSSLRFIKNLILGLDTMEMLPMRDDRVWKTLALLPQLETLEIRCFTSMDDKIPFHPHSAEFVMATTPSFPNNPAIAFPFLKKLRYFLVCGPGSSCLPPLLPPYRLRTPPTGYRANPNFPVLQQLCLIAPFDIVTSMVSCFPAIPTVRVAEIRTLGECNSVSFECARALVPNVEDLEVGGAGPDMYWPECGCEGDCPSQSNIIHWSPLAGLPNLKDLAVTVNGSCTCGTCQLGTFSPLCFDLGVASGKRCPTKSYLERQELSEYIHLDQTWIIGSETSVAAVEVLAENTPSLNKVSLVTSLGSGEVPFGVKEPECWERDWRDSMVKEMLVGRHSDGEIEVQGSTWLYSMERGGVKSAFPASGAVVLTAGAQIPR